MNNSSSTADNYWQGRDSSLSHFKSTTSHHNSLSLSLSPKFSLFRPTLPLKDPLSTIWTLSCCGGFHLCHEKDFYPVTKSHGCFGFRDMEQSSNIIKLLPGHVSQNGQISCLLNLRNLYLNTRVIQMYTSYFILKCIKCIPQTDRPCLAKETLSHSQYISLCMFVNWPVS